MLSILGWLFIGTFFGSIAQAVLPCKNAREVDCMVLMSVAGSLIGGLILGSPLRPRQGDATFAFSLVLAGIGSLVVLALQRSAIRLSVSRPGVPREQLLELQTGSAAQQP